VKAKLASWPALVEVQIPKSFRDLPVKLLPRALGAGRLVSYGAFAWVSDSRHGAHLSHVCLQRG
jgi:hypothetical protein